MSSTATTAVKGASSLSSITSAELLETPKSIVASRSETTGYGTLLTDSESLSDDIDSYDVVRRDSMDDTNSELATKHSEDDPVDDEQSEAIESTEDQKLVVEVSEQRADVEPAVIETVRPSLSRKKKQKRKDGSHKDKGVDLKTSEKDASGKIVENSNLICDQNEHPACCDKLGASEKSSEISVQPPPEAILTEEKQPLEKRFVEDSSGENLDCTTEVRVESVEKAFCEEKIEIVSTHSADEKHDRILEGSIETEDRKLDNPDQNSLLESGDASSAENEPEVGHKETKMIPEPVSHHPLQQDETGLANISVSQSLDSLTSKNRKRVSFRGEKHEDLVTGFFSAPDPWKFVAESTMQKVLEAYAHSCLHHKVQPLPKVLESIKKNPGNRQRVGVFDVSGENLDLTTVETFESIFMRMCFEELNLSACLSEDDLAVSLMDMLEYYQMVDKLIISNNKKLQFRGWLAVAKVLKKCCVYFLDVRGCILQDQNASLLTRAIRCGSNIVTLHIENCSLSGRPIFLLISALQYSETVQELFLGDNKLTPTDMIHFATALKHGWKIRLLDLRNNSLMDSGTIHLLESFVEGGAVVPEIRQLVLWNNNLTSRICKSLGRALMATKSLETLNLGSNDLSDEAVFALKEPLMHNHSLRRLGLQATKLSDEGCIALAEYLADHPRFLRLDVRFNNIRGGGWLALSHAVKLSPAIIRVDMNYSFKDVKHFETIRECQRSIQTVCLNNIERFEKGLVLHSDEDEEEVKNITENEEKVEVENEDEEIVPAQPELDLESSSLEFPEFMGSFTQEDTDSPSALNIDVPLKKCRPCALRRSSITSVSSTGPLSVSDRLHEELFPVQTPAQVSSASQAIVKGRFQISLVKATEKIYQSVQSVLSPTSNPPLPGQVGNAPELTSPSTDSNKGLFSWRATFRRGSKEGQSSESPVVSPNSSSVDLQRSPEKADANLENRAPIIRT